jgi:hypothetical protein
VPINWNKFEKHSATITSIASVFIAGCALYLTIHYASVDREYKEATIRPALHLDVETLDFHVGYLNTGPGAAVVQNVATKFESDRCLLLYQRERRPGESTAVDMHKLTAVTNPIQHYFADPLAELEDPGDVWGDPGKFPKLYVRTLIPGEVISPNQEIVVFQLQKEQLDIANKRLSAMRPDAYNRIISRFMERAAALPYYVNYCSLTGQYCVNQIEDNCGATQ